MKLLVVIFACAVQVAWSKPQFFFPGQFPGQIPGQSLFQPQQPQIIPAPAPAPSPSPVGIEATIAAAGGSDKLCGLLSFADSKCPSKSKECKKCVIDQLASRCPYPTTAGAVDCEKQKACATAQTFTCPP